MGRFTSCGEVREVLCYAKHIMVSGGICGSGMYVLGDDFVAAIMLVFS